MQVACQDWGSIVIPVINRLHQIVVFLDPQHADIADGWLEPRVSGRKPLHGADAADGVYRIITEIGAALLPDEAARGEVQADVGVGAVRRV